MSKSFHSKLREALDTEHLNGKLRSDLHYKLKRAMREANMRGRQFQNEYELAEALR